MFALRLDNGVTPRNFLAGQNPRVARAAPNLARLAQDGFLARRRFEPGRRIFCGLQHARRIPRRRPNGKKTVNCVTPSLANASGTESLTLKTSVRRFGSKR